MTKFQVDTEKTAEYIAQLKTLKEDNKAVSKKPTSSVASGKTYVELVELCEQMKEIRKAFTMLLEKTIGFLTIMDETFDTSDRTEAASVSKKSS